MAPNKRIVVNVIASYGRALYMMFAALFTIRWLLGALGETDYGLYGVIFGLTVFIRFFNGILAASITRFFAVAIGGAEKSTEGIDDCRRWFGAALTLHTIVPTLLIIIGYPIGSWAIRHYLTVPLDRIIPCVWVWRYCCVSCFVGMAIVPCRAMYVAKQEIAEVTLYSFIGTTCNFLLVWYMIEHPGFWLTRYALFSCLISIVPELVMFTRAFFLYPECRCRSSYLFDTKRICRIGSFAGWKLFGSLGMVFKQQGVMVLVNKFLGPAANAAATIGVGLSKHSQQLSSSLVTAFSPAVMNKFGAGQKDEALRLALRACKFSMFCVLIFAIPLIFEADSVMKLWLKTPPEGVASLGILILISVVIENATTGHNMLVTANGAISKYESSLGFVLFLAVPLCLSFLALGCGINAVGYAYIVSMIGCSAVRLFFARLYLNCSVLQWVRRALVPVVCVAGVTLVGCMFVSMALPKTVLRIFVTTAVAEVVLFAASWFVLFDAEEKAYLVNRIRRLSRKKE